MKTKKSLAELRDTIETEKNFVDVKPYSHNIISLTLNMIDSNYGREEAVKAMKDFSLEDLGWKIPEEVKRES